MATPQNADLKQAWALGPQFGTSLSATADFNGDGLADILVGAPFPAEYEPGRVDIVSSADGSILRSLPGFAPGDRFGTRVLGISDVNADAVADVVVMAPGGFAEPGSEEADAPNYTPGYLACVSGADGAKIWEILPEDGSYLGWQLLEMGDIDGDGASDVLAVECPGKGLGVRWTVHAISSRSGELLYEVKAAVADESFGYAMSLVPDQDEDDIQDYAVAAPAPSFGYVSVRSGATGEEITRVVGDRDQIMFGSSVAAGGDLSGDGAPDIAIGYVDKATGSYVLGLYALATGEKRADYAREDQRNVGYACAVVTDVNGDGLSDVVFGGGGESRVSICSFAEYEATELCTFTGEAADFYGASLVCVRSPAGDIRLVIGAPWRSEGDSDRQHTGMIIGIDPRTCRAEFTAHGTGGEAGE